MVAVGEALTESGDDFLSAPSDSMFVSNLVAAFRSGAKREMVAEDLRLALRLASA